MKKLYIFFLSLTLIPFVYGTDKAVQQKNSFGALYFNAHAFDPIRFKDIRRSNEPLGYIRSDIEYKNYLVALYENKDIKALKEELPSNLKNSKNELYTDLLFATIYYDCVEGMQYLLDSGMTPNTLNTDEEYSLLGWAVRKKKNNFVAMLLNHKDINPNIKNISGNTPLHVAITYFTQWKTKYDNKDINPIKMLLKHKDTNPNIKNVNGWTPLHEALFKGNKKITKYLLQDKRTSLEMTTMYCLVEQTSLMLASTFFEASEAVEMLLHYGADPNIIPEHGITALYIAILGGKYAAVKSLILGGADTRVKTKFNVEGTIQEFTPYEYAAFLQELPFFAKVKKERKNITQLLFTADILREEDRTKKLGNNLLFRGLIYKEMGITKRFSK